MTEVNELPGMWYGSLPDHPDESKPGNEHWSTVDIPVVVVELDQLTAASFTGTQGERFAKQGQFPPERWPLELIAELIWPNTFDLTDRDERYMAQQQLEYALERLPQFNAEVLALDSLRASFISGERTIPTGHVLFIPFHEMNESLEIEPRDSEEDLRQRIRFHQWNSQIAGADRLAKADMVLARLRRFRGRVKAIEAKLGEWYKDTIERLQVMTGRLAKVGVIAEAMLAFADLHVDDGEISRVIPGKRRDAWKSHRAVPLEGGGTIDLNDYLHAPLAWAPPDFVVGKPYPRPWPVVAEKRTRHLEEIAETAKELSFVCSSVLTEAAGSSELFVQATADSRKLLDDLANDEYVEMALRRWNAFPYRAELEDLITDAVTLASFTKAREDIFASLTFPMLALLSEGQDGKSAFATLPVIHNVPPHPLAAKLNGAYQEHGKTVMATGAVIPKLAKAALAELAVKMRMTDLHKYKREDLLSVLADGTSWACARMLNQLDIYEAGNPAKLQKLADQIHSSFTEIVRAPSVEQRAEKLLELRHAAEDATRKFLNGPMLRTFDAFVALAVLEIAYHESSETAVAENIAKTTIALGKFSDRGLNAALWFGRGAKKMEDVKTALEGASYLYNEARWLDGKIWQRLLGNARAAELSFHSKGMKSPIGMLLDASAFALSGFEFVAAGRRSDFVGREKAARSAAAAGLGLAATVLSFGLGPVGGALAAASALAVQYLIITPPSEWHIAKTPPQRVAVTYLEAATKSFNGSEHFRRLAAKGHPQQHWASAMSPEDLAATTNALLFELYERCKEDFFWPVGCYRFFSTGIVRGLAAFGDDLTSVGRSILRTMYRLAPQEAEAIVGHRLLRINETRPPSQPVG